MVTVNEHLPENHPAHVTDFGDIRDEAHIPPGNSAEGPAPTQDELAEVNRVMEESRGTVAGDASVAKEEDLLNEPHQGSSSWYSDPDAMSSDMTQRNMPGYDTEPEGEAAEGEGEGTEPPEDDEFDPAEYVASDVEAYAEAHPEEIGDILAKEYEGKNRTTLISKLEGMKVS